MRKFTLSKKQEFLWKNGRKYMDYVKGKGYYVGCFDENDIANKLDKKAVEKAKEETGLKYMNQEIVYKNKKSVGIKLYVCDLQTMRIGGGNEDLLERLDVVRMSDITEIVNIIEKSGGVNSIGCPFGLCTEEFANKKMLEIANKNNFPGDVLELIKANPIKFHKYQKFDNGRGIGRYYANLIRQMKR